MTTTLTTSDRRPNTTAVPARTAAYGAAVWALGFAAVNIYLQIVGIDNAQIQQNWAAFTALNLGVVGLKAFGAAVALATVQQWGRRVPAWLVSLCAWGGATMLLGYAALGLVTVTVASELLGWTLAGGTFWMPMLVYLGFFAVGGSLFAVTARLHQHRRRVGPAAALLGALGAPLLLGAVLLATSQVF